VQRNDYRRRQRALAQAVVNDPGAPAHVLAERAGYSNIRNMKAALKSAAVCQFISDLRAGTTEADVPTPDRVIAGFWREACGRGVDTTSQDRIRALQYLAELMGMTRPEGNKPEIKKMTAAAIVTEAKEIINGWDRDKTDIRAQLTSSKPIEVKSSSAA